MTAELHWLIHGLSLLLILWLLGARRDRRRPLGHGKTIPLALWEDERRKAARAAKRRGRV